MTNMKGGDKERGDTQAESWRIDLIEMEEGKTDDGGAIFEGIMPTNFPKEKTFMRN